MFKNRVNIYSSMKLSFIGFILQGTISPMHFSLFCFLHINIVSILLLRFGIPSITFTEKNILSYLYFPSKPVRIFSCKEFCCVDCYFIFCKLISNYTQHPSKCINHGKRFLMVSIRVHKST